MNKIYSLKYCNISRSMIAVSELATKRAKRLICRKLAPVLTLSLFSGAAQSAQLNIDNV
ncbi:TPA: ESPR-type extended signal peptide-containing protein [Providencia alcalifaciens]